MEKLTFTEYELVFMDGTTQTVKALDVQDAWVIGKVVAVQKKTYLLNIRPRKQG